MIESIAGIKRNKGRAQLAELLPGTGLRLHAGPVAVEPPWALRRGDPSPKREA